MKVLGHDYKKWHNKLNELESLMKTMLTQINEKRLALAHTDSDNSNSDTNRSENVK